MSAVAGSSVKHSLRDVKICLQVLGVCINPPTSTFLSINFSFDWLSCCYPNQLSHNNQIFGAVSQMDFNLGTVVITSITVYKLMNIARILRPNASHVDTINRIAARIKALFPELKCTYENCNVLIPCMDQGHWALVIATNGKIYWGDSLRFRPFKQSLQVVQMLMKTVFPDSDWIIQTDRAGTAVNCMLDVLKYEPQKDAYRCGFYVISINQFSAYVGEINAFPFTTYDTRITELYRRAAVIGFFYCVEDVSNQKTRLTEVDVNIDIMNKLRFYTKVTPDKALQLNRDKSIEKYAILVEDLPGYIEKLKSEMEFFELRRDYNPKNKAFSIRRLFNCFRLRKGCKVTLTARYFHTENIWNVTKSKVHSHSIEKPNSSVQKK